VESFAVSSGTVKSSDLQSSSVRSDALSLFDFIMLQRPSRAAVFSEVKALRARTALRVIAPRVRHILAPFRLA